MNNISPHITYHEAVKSQTAIRLGIENVPNAEQLECMKLVALKIFEPLREHFGVPIGISSFFRSKRLNAKIGGAKNSQHCTGQAIDIDGDIYGGVSNTEIFNWIRDNLAFDQLIREHGQSGWVHVSYVAKGNRGQVWAVG